MRCFLSGRGRTPPLPALAFNTTPVVFAGPFVDTVTPGAGPCALTVVPFNCVTDSSLSRFTPLLLSPAPAVCPPGVGAGVGIGVCRAGAVVPGGGTGVPTGRGVPTPAGVMPDG